MHESKTIAALVLGSAAFLAGAAMAERVALPTVNVQGIGPVPTESDYVPHVVACENGAASFEALKAQAVAARSYAYPVPEPSTAMLMALGLLASSSPRLCHGIGRR